jgi:hypothetical protein
VSQNEVLEQGEYTRPYTESVYIHVKFRCSDCEKPGEFWIRREEWDASLLS